MGSKCIKIEFPCGNSAKIIKWKVEEGTIVNVGRVILLYGINTNGGLETERKLKSTQVGTVTKLFAKEGDIVQPGSTILELEECTHPTVFKDMCAECGIDLRKDESNLPNASVPMVHSIPELKVSEEQAQLLGKADVERLLKHRKLVLLVDLDQTLIHTTNDNIPANLKDVYHFRLHGSVSPWYHTRLRPGTHRFLAAMDRLYELHICTFGARNYAHMIAMFLDQDGKFFSHRILSRDECFNPNSKTANLKALFPCGDNMVCIIDDREDVWNYASNLIHVKPYHFFKHTGDINAPPGLAKRENDDKEGFDFDTLGANKETSGKSANKDKTEQSTGKVDQPTDKEAVTKAESSISEKNDAPKEDETGSAGEISTTVSVSKDEDCAVVKASIESKESIERTKAYERTPAADSSASAEEKSTEVTNSETACETQGESELKPEEKMDDDSEVDVSGKKTDNTEATPEEKGSDKKDTDLASAAKTVVEFESDGGKADDELVELEDDDDYLLYLEEILTMIHKAFFKDYDKANGERVPDMKDVIPEVRSKVLSGVRMVFSGLVPTHVALEESRAYLVAVSLGATVEQDLSPQTTHLVAVRPGTAKVNAARNIPGLIQVTPKWLWSCAERWEHTDERLFPLSTSVSAWRHPPAHCTSPEHVSSAHGTPATRRRTPSGRFMDSINPLLSFSTEEIAKMDREVEDMFNESESDSESPSKTSRLPTVPEESVDGSSSSSASLGDAGEAPSWGLKRPASSDGAEPGAKTRCVSHLDDDDSDSDKEKDEDSDSGREKDGDEDSDSGRDDIEPDSEASVDPMDDTEGDWNDMGAALEREFLSD